MQNLVVIFSKEYDGKDNNATCSRDIIKSEETNRDVSLNLKREQIEKLENSSAAMEEKLFPRFEILLQIIQNRLSEFWIADQAGIDQTIKRPCP